LSAVVSQDLIDRIVNAYADFAAGTIDVDTLPIHPNVEWVAPVQFPYGGTYHGRNDVRTYLELSRSRWRTLSSTVRRVLVNESKVALLVEYHGVRVETDAEASSWVLEVFEIAGDLIVHMEGFADTAQGTE
jgi:ketosteroid isomerase-like protein